MALTSEPPSLVTLTITPQSLATDRGVMVHGRFRLVDRAAQLPSRISLRLSQDSELLASTSGFVVSESSQGSFSIMVSFLGFRPGPTELELFAGDEQPFAHGVFHLQPR